MLTYHNTRSVTQKYKRTRTPEFYLSQMNQKVVVVTKEWQYSKTNSLLHQTWFERSKFNFSFDVRIISLFFRWECKILFPLIEGKPLVMRHKYLCIENSTITKGIER